MVGLGVSRDLEVLKPWDARTCDALFPCCATRIRTWAERTKNSSASHYTIAQSSKRSVDRRKAAAWESALWNVDYEWRSPLLLRMRLQS